MPDLLLAIKPKYAELILSGEKTLEIRKRCPRISAGDRVYLYATAPVSAVVGYFIWDGASSHISYRINFATDLMILFRGACLTVSELLSYVGRDSRFYAWHVKNPVRFKEPKPVYRSNPPQSYRFLKKGENYDN